MENVHAHAKEMLLQHINGTATQYPDRVSPIELILRDELERRFPGVFIPQYKIGCYVVDFACPAMKIAVECDGHEFHSTVAQRSRDASKDRFLEMHGWLPVRFTGHEITSDTRDCVNDIAEILLNRRKTDDAPVVTGIVKYWFKNKYYGFITRDVDGQDAFVPGFLVRKMNLWPGDKVIFTCTKSKETGRGSGLVARDITLVKWGRQP